MTTRKVGIQGWVLLDQPRPALRVPEMIGLPWGLWSQLGLPPSWRCFPQQGKCRCWHTTYPSSWRTWVKPRGRPSDHPKVRDVRAMRSSSVNKGECNDTGPGTYKEEMPRRCDDCCPRCCSSCCPSKSNTPSALRTVACRGLTHGKAPRAGTSGELESSAKTQGREEAGQLSPPPCPHSCWGFSPCWLPVARVFCCYKHDQN